MLQTMQPNNLDNVKYGKLPRSVGEAKNCKCALNVDINIVYFIKCLHSSSIYYLVLEKFIVTVTYCLISKTMKT